jgi:hypothetical protein
VSAIAKCPDAQQLRRLVLVVPRSDEGFWDALSSEREQWDTARHKRKEREREDFALVRRFAELGLAGLPRLHTIEVCACFMPILGGA